MHPTPTPTPANTLQPMPCKPLKYRLRELVLQYESDAVRGLRPQLNSVMDYLAAECGVSRSTMFDWARIQADWKRVIPADALAKLCQIFDVPQKDLYTEYYLQSYFYGRK